MSFSVVQILILIVLTVNSLGGFYVLSQFLVGSMEFRARQPPTKIGREFIVLRNLSLFSMVSFILSQGIYMMCQLFFPSNFALGWIAWLLRMFTVFSFLIFQFWRLHTTFKDTMHRMDRLTIVWFIFVILVASVLAFFCGADIVSDDVLFDINLGLAICVTIVPIQCTILFSRKLFKIVIQLRESRSRTVDSSASASSRRVHVQSVASDTSNTSDKLSYGGFDSLSKRQVNLLETITKQTVCTLFQTLFFVISMPMFIFISYFFNFQESSDQVVQIVFLAIYFTFSIIGNIGMPLMIWFSFIFAKRHYFWFCNSCHQCWLTGFKKTAVRAQHDANYVRLEDDSAL